MKYTGKHTYDLDNITALSWGEGAELYVGSFCSIGANLTVYLGGNHRTDWATTYPFGHVPEFPEGMPGHPATKGDVHIKNDVWIGNDVTIMSGVTIGSGAVIGAHSVVTKDVNPYEIVAGNPAKFIKNRFPSTITGYLLALAWWEWPDEKIKRAISLLQQGPTLEILEELRHV
jgi:acetyltransferase-like isoleucine patch superfamily enzyme